MSESICRTCASANVSVIEYHNLIENRLSESEHEVQATLQCDTCGYVWTGMVENHWYIGGNDGPRKP